MIFFGVNRIVFFRKWAFMLCLLFFFNFEFQWDNSSVIHKKSTVENQWSSNNAWFLSGYCYFFLNHATLQDHCQVSTLESCWLITFQWLEYVTVRFISMNTKLLLTPLKQKLVNYSLHNRSLNFLRKSIIEPKIH